MFKKTKPQVHLFKLRYYFSDEYLCYYAESADEALKLFSADNPYVGADEPVVIIDCGIMKDPDDRE